MPDSNRLSDKAAAILGLIADGHSYAQIVDGHPDITYRDIFAAAEEALRLHESPSDHAARLAQIKARHPRAYAPWTENEDHSLIEMHRQGKTIADIAGRFQRQPSAIRNRLGKLGVE